MKKAIITIARLMSMFVTLPIWFFLMHTVLKSVNVDRLCWFLFWIYVPVTFLVSSILVIVDKAMEDK